MLVDHYFGGGSRLWAYVSGNWHGKDIPDGDLAPTVRTEGMRWVRQGPSPDNASAALGAYRASQLPPGFRLTIQGAQTLGGASAPASHLVYSDGVATVSVFVEEMAIHFPYENSSVRMSKPRGNGHEINQYAERVR